MKQSGDSKVFSRRNLVGTALGKYRLVALLGRGGMAEVYKGYQPRLKRYVAVKVMYSHLAYEENFLERFEREAAAVAQLRHPHIVRVYDFDSTHDEIFMVMELVEGATLKQELLDRAEQKIPLTLPEISTIFTDLASAVHYAHQEGMIHRDLKPANVMLNPKGQVVLTDFGIARLMHGSSFTHTGGIIGTPTYMSPEQGLGEEIDARSDIYSLSVILYQIVTGRVPFDKEMQMAMLLQQINEPPPRPIELNPAIPQAVEDVILKGLSKSPEDRYQTAVEMAQALQLSINEPMGKFIPIAHPPQVDELDPDDITPTTDSLGTVEFAKALAASTQVTKRERTYQAIIAAIIICVGVLAGTYLLSTSTEANSAAPPQQGVGDTTMVEQPENNDTAALAAAKVTDTPSITPTPTVDRTAQIQATATWEAADEDRDGLSNGDEVSLNTRWDKRDTDEDGIDDGDELTEWQTDPLRPDTDSDGLKDGVEISQGLNPLTPDSDGDSTPDSSDQVPLQAPTATNTPTPSKTPTRENTATPSPSSTITATVTPTPTNTPSRPALSLRGKIAYQLQSGQSSAVHLLDLANREHQTLASPGYWPTISKDGSKIVWQSDQGIFFQDFATGSITQLSQDRFDMEPAISTNGQKVAYINQEALYVIENGVAQSITEAQHSPSWGPDVNWIIMDPWNGNIYKKLMTVSDSPLEKIAENAFRPAFGPNRLIAFSRDGDIWIMDENGQDQQQITFHSAKDYHPAWSPDGKKIVFISERDGNPEIYVMARNGKGAQRITRSAEAESGPSWGK
ncbi:MAG: protein kinase [Chloroflexota bacterium]